MQEQPSLSVDERAELERLRAEVAGLRAQVEEGGPPGGGVPATRVSRQRWRTPVAVLLILVGCLLAPLSVLAIWAKNQVTDTDRYVATVTPLASDPVIQNAVADQITTQIFNYIDVQGVTTEAVDALANQGLNPRVADSLRALAQPIANGVEGFVRTQVGKVVQSQQFADAWVAANRTAHEQMVKALTGEGGGAVTVENGTVSIQTATIIATVKQQMIDAGFSLASRIPNVNASFVVFQSADLVKVQRAFNLLNTLGVWLPIVALVLIALGVYVARDHRRALVGAGLGVAAGMVVLAIALAVARSAYLNAVPSSVLPQDAAADIYDTLVRFLRAGLRTVAVLGLVVAIGAFFTGPSVTAVRTRQGLSGAIGWLRGTAEHAGLRTGPVGAWVHTYRRLLQLAAVGVASLVLVFWDRPTGKVVLGISLVLLAVLAVIEFISRPPEQPAGPQLQT